MWVDNQVDRGEEYTRVNGILSKCCFPEYTFDLQIDNGNIVISAYYIIGDFVKYTRKWMLPLGSSQDRIVKTAFRCILSSMEYRARKDFQYRDKAIFHPDIQVDDLLSIAKS